MSVLIALFGPAIVVFLRSFGFLGKDGYVPRIYAALLLWAVMLATLYVATNIDSQTLATVGFTSFKLGAFGWGLLFGILGMASFPLYIVIAKKIGSPKTPADTLAAIGSAPLSVRLFLLATAAIVEEILFRAVPISVLGALGWPPILVVALPLLVFVILHLSNWGLMHLLFVTIAGTIMTLAFLIGGLWAAVIAHLILDAPLMLAGPAMAKRASPTPQADDLKVS